VSSARVQRAKTFLQDLRKIFTLHVTMDKAK